MAKYLVTGGAGFIGSNIVEGLLAECSAREGVVFEDLADRNSDTRNEFPLRRS